MYVFIIQWKYTQIHDVLKLSTTFGLNTIWALAVVPVAMFYWME